MTAKIGAEFLCSEQQITQDVRRDHAPYIDSWLKLLKPDPKAVVTAAARFGSYRFIAALQRERAESNSLLPLMAASMISWHQMQPNTLRVSQRY